MSVASEASMDCELCEKSLVDLLYGELDEATSAQVRSHLEGCDGCRQAYEKLESGRAFARKLVIEPAPSLSKVLVAAREQAAANRAAREQVVAPITKEAATPAKETRTTPEEEGSFASWLRWLGAMVMGPQLGVATVLLLVVGIGLWYLPQLGGGGDRGATPLLEPDPQQTSETTALEPAEPLQLSHDPRTGRVTVEDERETGEAEEAPPSAQRPEREVARAETPSEVRHETDEPRTPAEADERLAALEAVVPPSEDPGAVQEDSLPELTTAAGAYEGGAIPTAPTPVAPPGQGATWARPSTPPPTQPSYDMDAVPGGPQGEDLAAAALHGQARQLAAAGRCADSVARYQQLQSRYPSYPEGGRASVEMADCLRRLGRGRDARVALERASHSPVPAVAAAARRQIVEMDMADRAAREEPAATQASD
jgi:predicted anti-sigma-YlaC factor YlaD